MQCLDDLVGDIKSLHPEYTSKDILSKIVQRDKVDEIVCQMNAIRTPLMGIWNTAGGTQKKLKSRLARRVGTPNVVLCINNFRGMSYMERVSHFIQALHDTPSLISGVDGIDSYSIKKCRSYTQDEFFEKIASDTMCYVDYVKKTYDVHGRYYISFSDGLNDHGVEDDVYTAVMNISTGKIDRVFTVSFQLPRTMMKQVVTPIGLRFAGLRFAREVPVMGDDGKPLVETVMRPRVLFWDELEKEIEGLSDDQVIVQIDGGEVFFPIA